MPVRRAAARAEVEFDVLAVVFGGGVTVGGCGRVLGRDQVGGPHVQGPGRGVRPPDLGPQVLLVLRPGGVLLMR